MAVGFSNTIGTFKVDLDKVELNSNIEQYIESMAIEHYYGDDEPDESFRISGIKPKYIEVEAMYIFNKDYYSIEHIPVELVLTVSYSDDYDYDTFNVYIRFRDLNHHTGEYINYTFDVISDNWSAISISEDGEIETY